APTTCSARVVGLRGQQFLIIRGIGRALLPLRGREGQGQRNGSGVVQHLFRCLTPPASFAESVSVPSWKPAGAARRFHLPFRHRHPSPKLSPGLVGGDSLSYRNVYVVNGALTVGDAVIVDDSADPTGRSVTLSGTPDGRKTLTGLAPAPISF